MKLIQAMYLLKVIQIMKNHKLSFMACQWTGQLSYRPGSRFGPQRIREVSIGLRRIQSVFRP